MTKLTILPFLASYIFAANTIFYVGQTFEFAEADMLDAIQQHIANNQELIERKYEEMKKKAQSDLDNLSPKVTSKPKPATENRKFFANTIYTHPEDIRDATGKIIYPKGYTFDPMEYVNLPYSIIIINAARKEEIEWLKTSGFLGEGAYRVFITEGTLSESIKALKQNIFFADDKILSRLNVVATPSIVRQEGKKLSVEEIAVNATKNP